MTMEPGPIEGKSVRPQHLKDLHYVYECLLPVSSYLICFEQTVVVLRKTRLALGPLGLSSAWVTRPTEQFGDVSAAVHNYKINCASLLERWKVTVDMVNTTLNLADQRHSHKQNILTTALGGFAAADSASIHVITIITLGFLCFSVISVCQQSHNLTGCRC